MSDIQYVQRPFQQFCTKTISICPSCSTQLTILFHEQSPMLPVLQEKSPYMSIMFHDKSLCSQHVSRTNRKFSNMFPWNYKKHRQFPPFFHPFSSMFQPFSNHFRSKIAIFHQKMPIFPGFSPDFPSQLQPSPFFHRGTVQRRWPRGAALGRPAAWPPGASARQSPGCWRGAPWSTEKCWVKGRKMVNDLVIFPYMKWKNKNLPNHQPVYGEWSIPHRIRMLVNNGSRKISINGEWIKNCLVIFPYMKWKYKSHDPNHQPVYNIYIYTLIYYKWLVNNCSTINIYKWLITYG